jgi:membrane protease YdiL (CAAX protease family)
MLSSIAQSVRRRPVVWYFVLAYAICAVAYFSHFIVPLEAYSPRWWIGVFSPTIAALLLSGVIGGWPEIKRLLEGYTRWRIGWRWYLAAASLALLPLVVALIYIALGNPPSGLKPGVTLWTYPGLLIITLLAGPLAEESGWRGFALPRMQSRMGALNASLLLGVLWAFWHGPLYLTGFGSIPFVIFVPLSVSLAILFTWVFNNTRGSLVATTLMHFSFNFAGGHLAGHLGLAPAMLLNIAGGVGLLLAAIIVAIAAGPKYLSRRPASEIPLEPPAAPVLPMVPPVRPTGVRP